MMISCILQAGLALLLFSVVVVDSFIVVDPSSTGGIAAAIQNSTVGSTVYLKAGKYVGIENCNLVLDRSLNLVGMEGPAATIIDCEYKSRCLTVFGTSTIFNITGLSLRHGFNRSPNNVLSGLETADFGGCMLIGNGCIVSVSRTWVTGCKATQGAGIGVTSAKSVLILDSVISFNGISITDTPSATNLRGGGAYILGTPKMIIKNTIFDSNVIASKTGSAAGSGLCIRPGTAVETSLYVANATFSNNGIVTSSANAQRGAGLYVAVITNFALEQSIISSNYILCSGAAAIQGSGLFFNLGSGIATFSDLIIVGNTILNNASGGRATEMTGSGLVIGNRKSVSISNLKLLNNSITCFDAVYGAGALFSKSSVSFFGSLEIVGNSIIQLGSLQGFAAASGVSFGICDQVLLTVDQLLIQENKISTVANGYVRGAFFVEVVAEFTLVASRVIISDNSIVTGASSLMAGAGIFIKDCSNATIAVLDFFSVARNSILVTPPTGLPGQFETFTPSVETSDPKHCSSQSPLITSSSGSLSDGSADQYSEDLRCLWIIDAIDDSTFAQHFGRFNISFERFDLEESASCTSDSLALYDGPSSEAPLIGIYCGQGRCSTGKCPSLQHPFFTTTTALTVLLKTDHASNGDGFLFNWTSTANYGFSSGEPGVIPGLTESETGAVGAGVAVAGSLLRLFLPNSINGAHFIQNEVFHPIFASGSAIAAIFESKVEIHGGIHFQNNVAKGAIAAGGAITSMENSAIIFAIGTSQFINNTAVGTGRCYPFNSGTVRCAASFGGAMSIAVGGAIILKSQSGFWQNSVTCDGASCSAHGGAISINSFGNFTSLSSCLCSNNSVVCEKSGLCGFGSGGCLYSSDGSVELNFLIAELNFMTATGGGGAVSVAGDSYMKLSESDVNENTAEEGGGFRIAGTSTVQANNVRILSNTASSIAGGISAIQGTSLLLFNCFLANNTARSRASSILLFNDNNSGNCVLGNVTISQAEATNAVIMLGNIKSPVTVFNCTRAGSIVQVEYSPGEYYSATCTDCGPGTYAADFGSSLFSPARSCLPCPAGATCKGSQVESNGLMALAGFWGFVDNNGTVTFYQCPPEYCCPQHKSGECRFNYCQGNRIGMLCGSCPEGSGLVFFTEVCVPESKCSQAAWVLPLAAIGAIIFVTFLYRTTKTQSSSGILSVILYFYQVLNLVKSSSWSSPAIARATAVSTAIANIAPSSSDESTSFTGICIIPSMSAAQKMGARILFQAWIGAMFIIIFVLHSAAATAMIEKRIVVNRKCYLAAFIRFLTISYVTLLLVPLQMLQCVYVNKKSVWMWDASVQCYETWQVAAMVVIGIVGTVPFGVMYVMWKGWGNIHELGENQKLVRVILQGGFKEETRWYLGFTLYRRFLLVLASSIIADKNWRSIAVANLCLFSLVIHLIMKPFANPISNVAETVSLTTLVVLSILSVVQMAQVQFGSSSSIASLASLEILEAVLITIPILMLPCCMFLISRRQQKDSTTATTNIGTRETQLESCYEDSDISQNEMKTTKEHENIYQYC